MCLNITELPPQHQSKEIAPGRFLFLICPATLMTKKHRSIGYLMDRCKTREDQVRLAQEWNDHTNEMQLEILDELKRAINHNRLHEINVLLAELRTLTVQNHEALDRMFLRLTGPIKKSPPHKPEA